MDHQDRLESGGGLKMCVKQDGSLMVDLSIISPVYGCAGCLKALHHRASRAARDLDVTYEIILVDDRSPDESWPVMASLAEADPEHVRAIRLSRNYGQHAAITAGLAESRGRAAVVIDCDLQDPPEDIGRLYAKFLEGHRIVLTRRTHKKHHPLKKLTASVYARLLSTLTDQDVKPEVGTFSLIGRPVIDAFLRFKDVNRHYLYILGWLGFDPVYIDYEHQERAAGRSAYTFHKLVRHALQGVFFQTTEFLQAIVGMGILLFLVGLAVSSWAFYIAMTGRPVSGWASTLIITSLLGGFVIFIQGVIGLYVGQIFDQVKDRPLYVIAERLGGESSAGLYVNELPPARVVEGSSARR
jgi:dolichol-phosphate mannosyltransferase